MTSHKHALVMDAKEDPHSPVYTGAQLEQLKTDWQRQSEKIKSPSFDGIAPIKSVALVGAVRNHVNGKLNVRDEVANRAIMQELLAAIPLARDYKLDLYNLSEQRDIFAAETEYDVVIFCNLRAPLSSLQSHYQKLVAEGKLTHVISQPRVPVQQYGHDLDRAVADTLRSSEILSGIEFTGIAEEHKYYVTVSEAALETNAYLNLAKKLNARFIACWGFVDFIHGGYFTSPTTYDFTRLQGERLLNRDDFSLTSSAYCGFDLINPFVETAQQVMPHPPHIHFVVRNDVLEDIAMRAKPDMNSVNLFSDGLDHVRKFELAARTKIGRGRNPIVKSWEVAGKSLAQLQRKAARPLNFIERTGLMLRRSFG